jgi:glutamate/tyrosine decarboxylase-like PLP-dependent enzyme
VTELTGPALDAGETEEALRRAADMARAYLAELAQLPAKEPDADAAARAFRMDLPERGLGAPTAVSLLGELLRSGSVQVAGPRFFHLVAGGTTPAALAGDWLTSAFDQHAFASLSSPIAAALESLMIDWLKDLFALPPGLDGLMVTGGSMANFTGLAAARQWWGNETGFNVAEGGLAGRPPMLILTSGLVHSTIHKAAAMLGVGRQQVKTFAADSTGRIDLLGLEAALREAKGHAVVVGNAGEVNAGDFDPIRAMGELAREHGAWFHVDGTFGLFARVTDELRGLADGVELADSIVADGHKWMNLPFDCGFCFVRDRKWLSGVFGQSAAYLNDDSDTDAIYGFLGPEMSRRARAFPVFATLAAYGRNGYSELVERGVANAKRLADQVSASDDFELLAEPCLCITSFRYRPPGTPESDLDDLNSALGRALLSDGRLYMGTTRYRDVIAFKPAFVNWRTTEAEVDLILPVVRELAASRQP